MIDADYVVQYGTDNGCPCIHYMKNGYMQERFYGGLQGWEIVNLVWTRRKITIEFNEVAKRSL